MNREFNHLPTLFQPGLRSLPCLNNIKVNHSLYIPSFQISTRAEDLGLQPAPIVQIRHCNEKGGKAHREGRVYQETTRK